MVEGYGETCEAGWVGDTLVLATVLFGKAHVRFFSREQLYTWFSRAWDYGFDHPDEEFSTCVAETFEQPLELADRREVA